MIREPCANECAWCTLVPMTQPSAFYRLIETQLPVPFAEFIAERRLPTKSWPAIAAEIKELTGEEVSTATLRNWFNSYGEAAESTEPAAA
jgi:hypothetical protein